MQNKGLIRFLTYAFLLVCLFQLTFTVATRGVEKRAKADVAAYLKSDATSKMLQTLAGGDELQARLCATRSLLLAKLTIWIPWPKRKFGWALPIASAKLAKSIWVSTLRAV